MAFHASSDLHESSNLLSGKVPENLTWILDNSAPNHIMGRLDLMRDIRKVDSLQIILQNSVKATAMM